MKLFYEGELGAYLSKRSDAMRKEVMAEPKNRLLNVNEVEYVNYLFSKYEIEPLNFQWELMALTDAEKPIPAERFPSNFYVEQGNSYSKQVLTFHIPFVGDRELLKYRPSAHIVWSMSAEIKENAICFDIINWQNDREQMMRIVEDNRGSIQRQLSNVLTDVANYNSALRSHIEVAFQARKKQLLDMSNILESLGVPLKVAKTVPESFSIPISKTKPIIKPTTSDEAYSPEPAINESVYTEILKICYQTGVEMERHPSIYHEKNEETLRDHFLMVLAPHFQSVTGETFNKKGKTDILIRHEQSNVFVAECKFWKGEKSLFSTIDQILSYLTWRDSKAAILFFVRNKDIGSVVSTIETATTSHSCFVAINDTKVGGCLDFDFRLGPETPKRVRLSILVFHFPDEESNK